MRSMVQLPVTPTDIETGLPYCFLPPPDLPPAPSAGFRNIERHADWNHQFPKSDIRHSDIPVITDVGGLALQNLRVQWVDYDQHHKIYNFQFAGPVQPRSNSELFKTLVMGLAGSIPEMALDLSGDEPREVGLTPSQRHELWLSGQVRPCDARSVYTYLFNHVFEQDVDHIRFLELEEFLQTCNHQRKLYLGHCLAAKLVERAVEPIESVYRSAALNPLVPVHPRDFVKRHLTPSRFGPVINELHRVLGSERRRVRSEQLVAA
jgi:hypothetical protein